MAFSTLEKIFIREEMYIDFKLYGDRESLYTYLYERFEPFKKSFVREINDDDLQKLTQIQMIRITRFDSKKADEKMKALDARINEIDHHLANLIDYAVEYFKNLKKKYFDFQRSIVERIEINSLKLIESNFFECNIAC